MACYRSTASTESNDGKLLELLDAAVKQHGMTHRLIMGDFNYPAIDFSSDTVRAPEGSHPHNFLEMIHDLTLVQNAFYSTRFRVNCEPSSLDYIFTDEENMIDNFKVR